MINTSTRGLIRSSKDAPAAYTTSILRTPTDYSKLANVL